VAIFFHINFTFGLSALGVPDECQYWMILRGFGVIENALQNLTCWLKRRS
jgi:hypothetical protein